MTYIALLGVASFLLILISIYLVLSKYNSIPWFGASTFLFLLITALFHISNVIEWSKLSSITDPYEGFLLPMIWVFFIFSNINKIEIINLKNAENALQTQKKKLEHINVELNNTNSNLNTANRRLMELDTLKNEFISIASHELRTPVTAILGFVQTLLSPDVVIDEKKRGHFLKIIETESRRLSKLINDLFDIQKIELHAINFIFKEENLFSIFTDVTNSIQLLPNQTITVTSDSQRDIFVRCNRDLIKQVFFNLFDNALRYSTQVEVRITSQDSTALVSVHDYGSGIPSHHLVMIFEKFYRVKGERHPGTGSGLGLAIAKEIIIAHGGSIWAQSEENAGTTIFFTLKK